jgi:hypothetical protein
MVGRFSPDSVISPLPNQPNRYILPVNWGLAHYRLLWFLNLHFAYELFHCSPFHFFLGGFFFLLVVGFGLREAT